MKFGVHLPHIGPFHDGESMRRFAETVEEMGYDSLWGSDHIAFPAQFASKYPYSETGAFPLPGSVPWLEEVTSLTYVAAVTSRVQLGTSICVLPYRNPVFNAKVLGNLDVLSGGRLIAGVGAGWLAEEAEAMGMPFDQRGLRTDEHIEVLKALWTQDDPSYEGRFFSFPALRVEPKPVQKPHPPIWVGGHEPAALRRTARYGDGWHAYRLNPDELAEKFRYVQEKADDYGRDPAAIILSVRAPLAVLDASPPASVPFLGTLPDIREHLTRYREVGTEHIVFEPPLMQGIDPALSVLERFAKEVRPEFEG